MRPSFHTCAALALLVSAVACGTDAGPPTLSPPPEPPRPLGVYQIAVTGIGTADMRSTITPSRADGQARGTLTPLGNGLTFEQVGGTTVVEGTRTAGGQRYVTFTYRVRNGTGSPLNNVTMLMVTRSNTIAGTPLSSLRRFDGTDASPAIATSVVPTGAVSMGSDLVTMQSPYPDVLQVLQESEVAAITPPAGVTGIFPYGYVVRSALTEATSRQLPAATSANQYDGVLTLSFRLPMQPTSAQDVFSLFFEVLAVQDSETRLTETIEEAQDTAAVRRLRERAASLGATTVTVLPGSTVTASDVADYPGQRQICSVRTAGTTASPVTTITARGAYSRLEMLLPGESSSACGAGFRSGTPTSPAASSAYPVTLKAMDRYGNVLTTIADTVSLSQLSGPSATFGAPAALASGVATINVTYTGTGTSVLLGSGRRIRGRRSIFVPASATVAVNGGNNQAAMAGGAVPTAPSVVVRDLSGNPLAGVPVTFTVTGGGGSVTGGSAVTNASGIATLGSWVLGSPAAVNTLTATAAGASSPAAFTASGCQGGGGTGYAITLCYSTAMTANQRAAFDSAAAKWGRVVTGDLANIAANVAAGACTSNSPSFNLTIDDLLIFATVEPIDGAGAVLGAANWCFARTTGGLPVVGYMLFDSADMATMEGNGTLAGVILHEMGHVIGIGTRWSAFGLLQSPSPVGGPPLDTYYSGSNGITGFNNIGGSTYTGGNKVPVENQFGGGTINAHWRESVLQNELMTGFANVGSMPLSQLTVRSLADMGYTVNAANADAFFLTLSLRDGPAPDAIPLGNDILNLPRYTIDEDGRTARVR